ncbi:MAG TPA: Gfo/Idh/MocA family oxidoreductase [Rhizobacter sp.]|nr:Gfo/Idh/MocA family oxidoreductase [Rhizobacter sp.]
MRWGFIGASNIAERVIGSLRKIPGQELVGVVSRNGERAKAFAAEQGLAMAHTELDGFLREGRFDAVYVSSTNEQHCAQTLAALTAGCHVMCEKPLAMSLADANRMVDAAKAAGRVLGTNHHLRASDCHRHMRQLMADGTLGRVHGVQVSHAVYLPPHLQGWRLDQPEAGGGVMLDILVHNADLLRFLLQLEPRRIHASAAQIGLAKGTVEDSAMSVIEFDGGVLAQTHQSFVAKHATTSVHVLGTEGSLYAEGSLTSTGAGRLWLRNAEGETELSVQTVDLHAGGFAAFIRACAGDGQPLATGADGARSMATALAGLASARSGRTETID